MRYAVAEWAASKGLGPNVGALETEMLCAKAILEAILGIKIYNSALEEMLRVLQNLAHDAEGVLGELECFRIQDILDAVNEHPKASGHNLLLNATHTAKAVGKLIWSAVCTSAANTDDGYDMTAHLESMRKKRQSWCLIGLMSPRESSLF